MIQSAKENAAKRKKAGGKSIREAALAADAEKLRERGRLIDGDSDWSPLRRTPEELAAEIEQQKAPELIDAAVAEVVVTKANPRTLFDEEALAELAASLREQGLIQPITVRRVAGGSLELIAGERRLRAAKRLGWTSIKAIVQPLDDVQAVEARAVENIVRENLNAIETAVAYRQMMEATGESQAQLAKRLGCSQPKIAHAVALLKLPEIWKARLIAGEVNASDARTLAPWVNRPKVLEAFDEVWTADQKDAKSYQEPPQEFEFLLGEAVNEATEPLAGHDFHRG
ncbi:MAG TPA: ParB/RepB/Spo0J family partition protein, partial [Pirellulales bacterium]